MRRSRALLSILLVATLAITAGAPSIGFDFVYDDKLTIVDRPPAWSEGFTRFLSTRHWGTGRHAALLSLDLDRLWLGGRPAAFHATNVALSVMIACMVLGLARRIGMGEIGAAAAAGLFAVHPTHVDAVAALAGRAELLAALGVLAALLAAIRREGDETRSGAATVLACAAGAFLAFHSKESALCLPGLIVLAWAALPGRVRIGAALAGVAVALLAWAVHILPLASTVVTPQYVDNPLAYEPLLTRIPKALAVLGQYAGLMLWPHPLLLDRSFAQTHPSLVAGITATAAWVLAAGMLLWLRPRAPRLFFAAAWFAVAFAVTANIAFPTGTIMAERLLFLPSLGPCLAAGLVIDWVAERVPRGRALAAGSMAVAAALLLWLFQIRAAPWGSADAYFPALAAASPRSAKAQYDYGRFLLDRKRQAEALEAFERALAIHPQFSRATFYLAERRASSGDIAAGITVYQNYLDVMPEDANALVNLTRLLLSAGREREAVTAAQRLVAMAPESAMAREVLITAETAARRLERQARPVSP